MKTRIALTWLRRIVLAGFLCALGLATLGAAAHPTRTHLVCVGAGGMSMVVLDDHGQPASQTSHASLDCPFCLPSAGPVPAAALLLPAPALAALTPQARPLAGVLAPSAAPPPGRGPPVFT